MLTILGLTYFACVNGGPVRVGNADLRSLRTPWWRVYCSCPIHRALGTVSIGDKSPNYKGVNTQLRNSYNPLMLLKILTGAFGWR